MIPGEQDVGGQSSNSTLKKPERWFGRVSWSAWLLWCACVVLVFAPAAAALMHAIRSVHDSTTSSLVPRWGLCVSSVLWAAGIGLLAVALAWFPSWSLRRGRRWVMPLVMLPMLTPSYLVYHSLGMIRAPTTWLGELLARSSEHGLPDLPVLVGRALAIGGLGLWSWPLAVLVLAPSVRGLDQGVLDALRLDGTRWWSRAWQHVLMLRGALLRAWGLVTVVMLGSAVPLHLAQAPTLSVAAWQQVVLRPGSSSAWVVSWPLLLIAACASWIITRRARAHHDLVQAPAPASREEFDRATVITLLICALCIGLPPVLYAASMRSAASVASFLRLSGEAVGWSVAVAWVVGAAGWAICMLAWREWAGGSSTAARLSLFVLLVGVLVPGVLVGHAWASLWSMLPLDDRVRESVVAPALAHLTRFAGLCAWCGVALSRLEHGVLRDARMLDAGDALAGWWRASVKPAWWAPCGAGLALACLSLHEVESTIVLQPPGLTSLAQTMLSNLHFARQEETSAGSLVVMGLGLVPAVAASCLLWLGARKSAGRM